MSSDKGFSPEKFLKQAEEEIMAAIDRDEYIASVTLAGYEKATKMINYFKETEDVDQLTPGFCLWLRELLAVDERYYPLPQVMGFESRKYQYVIVFCW